MNLPSNVQGPAPGQSLTIGQFKPISHHCHRTRRWIEAVDHVGKGRRWAEILQIPVKRVGEVDVSISRIDGHVIEGIELPTEIVVDKHYLEPSC